MAVGSWEGGGGREGGREGGRREREEEREEESNEGRKERGVREGRRRERREADEVEGRSSFITTLIHAPWQHSKQLSCRDTVCMPWSPVAFFT